MADEVTNYLEAFNEAQRHMVELRTMAAELSDFMKKLGSGETALYQTVPSKWPSAQQLQDMLSNAKSALDKTRMLFAQVPHHLRAHIPEPDSLSGRGPMDIDLDDDGYA